MVIRGANVQEDRPEESSLEKLEHLMTSGILWCTIFLLSVFLCYPENRKGLEFTTQIIIMHLIWFIPVYIYIMSRVILVILKY